MSTALIESLEAQGVRLRIDGEQLRASAPHGVITPALRAQIAEHKPELLAELRRREAAALRDALEADWQALQAMEPSNCGHGRYWGTLRYETTFARFVANLEKYEQQQVSE